MTNCLYVRKGGISNDMISDHYTVFRIKKKCKENKKIVEETVRDYKHFDKDIFCQTLAHLKWDLFDIDLDPSSQWEWLLGNVIDILSVMCPYKKVHTRTPRKKWMTPGLFSLIRKRKRVLKNYRINKDP